MTDDSGTWRVTATTPLAQGTNTITATARLVVNVSTASDALVVMLDTAIPPAPVGLTLAPASDSGTLGDDITNVITPVITGDGANGDVVRLYDGSTLLGSASVSGGRWSVTTATLVERDHTLTATETDPAGNTSTASIPLSLSVDTAAPAVTAALAADPLNANSDGIVFSQILAGGGDANSTVSISEDGNIVGTAQADAAGAWSFDPSKLSPGVHTLVASETDAAGNTGSTSGTPVTVPDPDFSLTTVNAATAGLVFGTDYTGPVSYLQKQYAYTGSDNVVIGARVANVFIYSGVGDDALAAYAGSNVPDGGSGSNWLVGASGADGGKDTFFLEARGGQATWDTLLNFHTGDMLTLWGFKRTSGSTNWLNDLGASGYHGATLEADFGDGSNTPALVTFEGLTTSNATFATSTGTTGGLDYLAITRTA